MTHMILDGLCEGYFISRTSHGGCSLASWAVLAKTAWLSVRESSEERKQTAVDSSDSSHELP